MLLSGDPKTLNEHCFYSFSQTPEHVDARWRYMTQFVLEDICHLHATLLTDDQQADTYGLNVKDGLTVHYHNLHHLLHSSRFYCGTRQKEGGKLLISSTQWLLHHIFVAVHRFYGLVKLGTVAKAADPNCDLLGSRGYASQPACTTRPSPDICVFSELVGWHCRHAVPTSEWRHTCAPFIWSFLAAVGRFSTFLRYQLM